MNKELKVYDLAPETSQKSFYGKAKVLVEVDRTVLFSYGTPIVSRYTGGKVVRHYEGWSSTTGRHINSFSGLRKKEFVKLPYEPYKGSYIE
jgi:hypothetical protein